MDEPGCPRPRPPLSLFHTSSPGKAIGSEGPLSPASASSWIWTPTNGSVRSRDTRAAPLAGYPLRKSPTAENIYGQRAYRIRWAATENPVHGPILVSFSFLPMRRPLAVSGRNRQLVSAYERFSAEQITERASKPLGVLSGARHRPSRGQDRSLRGRSVSTERDTGRDRGSLPHCVSECYGIKHQTIRVLQGKHKHASPNSASVGYTEATGKGVVQRAGAGHIRCLRREKEVESMPDAHRIRSNNRPRTANTHEYVPRSRSGLIDRRWERTGTEPVTARSALRLRLLLSVCFVPLFTAAAVLFALWSAYSGAGSSPTSSELAGLAALCGVLTVFSAVDLVVVLRRRRREGAALRNASGSAQEGG
jgi:hypothetical protein